MPSLRELQRQFADALCADPETAPAFAIAGAGSAAARIAIYRRTVSANYRSGLGATYPVVQRLVGKPFFAAAVDEFTGAHPSRGGDLNVYGDAFADFLAGYPPASGLPYLADVARLEWAIDEANRAADAPGSPDIVLGAMAIVLPERLPALQMRLHASCRLIASAFPILRIWQVNQSGYHGDDTVSLDEGADHLLLRRGADGIELSRIPAPEFAWLAALTAGEPLATAIEMAQGVAAAFDLGAVLHAHIGNGTIAAVVDHG